MDDPDELLESAEPPEEPVVEAPELRHRPAKGPYHASIALELVDDLHLSIGQGLALVGAREDDAPALLVEAIASYLERVFAGAARLPRDPSDGALALACLYGQALCRQLGWGWAHLRRARPPGIVVVSRDARHVTGPRAVVDQALSERSAAALRDHFRRLQGPLPESEPGRYLRVR
jgi:hypothetical protein